MCVAYVQALPAPLLPSLAWLLGDAPAKPLVKGGRILRRDEVAAHLAVVEARAAAWRAQKAAEAHNPVTVAELLTGFLSLVATRTFSSALSPGALLGFDPYHGVLLERQETLVVLDPFVEGDNCASNVSPRNPSIWRKVGGAFSVACAGIRHWIAEEEGATAGEPPGGSMQPVVMAVLRLFGRRALVDCGLLASEERRLQVLMNSHPDAFPALGGAPMPHPGVAPPFMAMPPNGGGLLMPRPLTDPVRGLEPDLHPLLRGLRLKPYQPIPAVQGRTMLPREATPTVPPHGGRIDTQAPDAVNGPAPAPSVAPPPPPSTPTPPPATSAPR